MRDGWRGNATQGIGNTVSFKVFQTNFRINTTCIPPPLYYKLKIQMGPLFFTRFYPKYEQNSGRRFTGDNPWSKKGYGVKTVT